MGYWLGYTFILIGGLLLAIALMLGAQRYWATSPSRARFSQNMALALLTFFLTFMAVEFFFKTIFAQSDTFSYTLANRNWVERYWIVNSMGYRDVEWNKIDLNSKKKILVLGDSLAAGYGIENIEDRFSNLLGEKLGNDYLVMNIASPGLSTRQEVEKVKGFSYKPEILILQYYINDIRQAGEDKNQNFDLPEPLPLLKPLVENSYAFNFLYWRTVRLGPQTWQQDYWSWLKSLYHDPDIWWLHQQELITLIDGAASEQVKLIVVIFPALNDVKGSKEITTKVATLFAERGVPVIDISLLVEDIQSEQLVVNPWDAHPNKWLHRLVADQLYERMLNIEAVQVKR
jgi:hypothetical protein